MKYKTLEISRIGLQNDYQVPKSLLWWHNIELTKLSIRNDIPKQIFNTTLCIFQPSFKVKVEQEVDLLK